ncbi:MAG: hypothetical protein GXC72_06835 [Chitinophagaceae bacterium]|jgi:hypothetical protein|nr:hypothetical protein [Chitinophagaceae bacterium]
MRNRVLVCFFLVFAATSIRLQAQNAMLTKEETINYLNKKTLESIGHKYSSDKGYIGEVTKAEVVKDDKGVKIRFVLKFSSGTSGWFSFAFNPMHIKAVRPYTNASSSSINEASIDMIGNTCLYSYGSGEYYGYSITETKSTNYANFMYLRADAENIEKIKKALTHLQTLLKAEDDPFGMP